MRVIAVEVGFYDGARRRVGDEFDFDVAKFGNVPFKKDADGAVALEGGKQVRDLKAPRELPSWLVEATSDARAKLKGDTERKARRDRDAAVATAGPKRKDKGPAGLADVEDLVV